MTHLVDIPVKISSATQTAPGAGVSALLRETLELLERLLRYEEGGAIDLRSLPFGAADRERLEEFLGAGEIEITLNLDGKSRLRETAYPGVWWVEHRNRDEALVAELLEVTAIPEIAVSAPEDIAAGAERLRARLLPKVSGEGAR